MSKGRSRGHKGPISSTKPHEWIEEVVALERVKRCARCGVCSHWLLGERACPGVIMSSAEAHKGRKAATG